MLSTDVRDRLTELTHEPRRVRRHIIALHQAGMFPRNERGRPKSDGSNVGRCQLSHLIHLLVSLMATNNAGEVAEEVREFERLRYAHATGPLSFDAELPSLLPGVQQMDLFQALASVIEDPRAVVPVEMAVGRLTPTERVAWLDYNQYLPGLYDGPVRHSLVFRDARAGDRPVVEPMRSFTFLPGESLRLLGLAWREATELESEEADHVDGMADEPYWPDEPADWPDDPAVDEPGNDAPADNEAEPVANESVSPEPRQEVSYGT